MTRHGIATEKFSHLVIVGTHDHVLLDGDDDVEMTNDVAIGRRQPRACTGA